MHTCISGLAFLFLKDVFLASRFPGIPYITQGGNQTLPQWFCFSYIMRMLEAGNKYCHSFPFPQAPYISLPLDPQGLAFILLPSSWWQIGPSASSLLATVQVGKGQESNKVEKMDGSKLSQKSPAHFSLSLVGWNCTTWSPSSARETSCPACT